MNDCLSSFSHLVWVAFLNKAVNTHSLRIISVLAVNLLFKTCLFVLFDDDESDNSSMEKICSSVFESLIFFLSKRL